MIKNEDNTANSKSKDFLRTIIDEDIRTNKYGGNVVTRFPPEPNGYLHIGHAKSICLNFGIANDYNGRCHLRFDDTDPTKEDILYVNSIQEDVKWLGFDWKDKMFFASDYFDALYNYAVQLIKMGKAYVCSLKDPEIKEYRGTVTQAGKPSPYRNRTIEENLNMFERMKAGEFKDGEHVLRAKIDMASPNMKMRDPLLYRIRHANHYRTGDKWCIYPMYDFAHCLSDYIEGITHSICTLEFENNRELYDWILDELELAPPRPYQYEFARLNLDYAVVSKRKLLELVEKKYVNGWDDPRLSTISGLRRRGCTPESIRRFCESIGIAKANNNVDIAQFEFCVRDDLNQKAPRILCVLDPLKVTIENYPENQEEMIDAPYFPHDVPKDGSRKLPFSKTIYIEQGDFMENPSKGFYRLAPGQEVRLRHAYIIKYERIIKDNDGKIIEIICSYDPKSKSGGDISGKKVKGTIHWVSAKYAKQVEVRLYDLLFSVPNPQTMEDVNPNSLEIKKNCFIEPAVLTDKPDVRYQFERQGYFYIDPIDSKDDKLVFNRIVQLKDSWNKAAKPIETKPAAKNIPATKPVTQETYAHSPEIEAKITLFQNKFDLNREIADIIAKDANLSESFEKILSVYNKPESVANWVANELSREIKDKKIADLKCTHIQMAELIELIDNGVISWKLSKDIFEVMLSNGENPKKIVETKGLTQISDNSQLEPIVNKVIANNPENLAKYKEGKTSLLGFFVGQVMKETQGKANPKLVNDIILKKLSDI
jgi:glutaminyl-tRNA synthetase